MNDFLVVIPARYGSTRLSGKPLLDIGGMPMVQRVYLQAKKSRARQVIVATDDQRVFDVVQQFGGEACMTRSDHSSGTDRLQEVAWHYGWAENEIVINVQGDEPLIPPGVINQVGNNLARHADAGVATLCEPITDLNVFLDSNAVKVVMNQQGYALYFSRAPIPWPRDAFRAEEKTFPSSLKAYRHIGIYGYRVGFLNQFICWSPAALELTELLEQLRALANGVKIHVEPASEIVPGGVDTPADLEAVRAFVNGTDR